MFSTTFCSFVFVRFQASATTFCFCLPVCTCLFRRGPAGSQGTGGAEGQRGAQSNTTRRAWQLRVLRRHMDQAKRGFYTAFLDPPGKECGPRFFMMFYGLPTASLPHPPTPPPPLPPSSALFAVGGVGNGPVCFANAMVLSGFLVVPAVVCCVLDFWQLLRCGAPSTLPEHINQSKRRNISQKTWQKTCKNTYHISEELSE